MAIQSDTIGADAVLVVVPPCALRDDTRAVAIPALSAPNARMTVTARDAVLIGLDLPYLAPEPRLAAGILRLLAQAETARQ